MQRLRRWEEWGWPMWLDGGQARRRGQQSQDRSAEPGHWGLMVLGEAGALVLWALGSDGWGEAGALKAWALGSRGKVKHWIRRRSSPLLLGEPQCNLLFTRVETDCA